MRRTALALALILAASPVRAETPAQQADKLYQEGMALLDTNPAAACPKLEESYKLDPAIGTQFRLGECLEKLGKLARAHDVFVEVAEQAKRFGDKSKEEKGRQRATALEPKLGRVVVEGPAGAPGDLAVTIDGEATAIGKVRWVQPGMVKVRAQASGHDATEIEVKVEAGAEAKATIPALRVIVGGPEPAKPRDGSAQRAAGIAVGAGGLVVLGMGIGFGLFAKSTYDDALANECGGDPNACSPAGRQKGEDAFTFSYVSTGLFVGGGVALATGLVVALTAPSAPKKPAARIPVVVPVVGREGGGVRVGGVF